MPFWLHMETFNKILTFLALWGITVSASDEYTMCTEYEVVQGAVRAVNAFNVISIMNKPYVSALDDGKWYMFLNRSGRPLKIRNKGPSPANRPMTKTLGWLSDTHPLMEHGVTRNSLCFNTDNENICGERGEVQVRRCYGHYVYRFRLSFVPVRAGLSVEGDSTAPEEGPVMYTTETPPDHALVGQALATFSQVSSKTKCFVYCLLSTRCLSFNYGRKSQLCELNSNRQELFPRDFVPRDGFRSCYRRVSTFNDGTIEAEVIKSSAKLRIMLDSLCFHSDLR